MTVGAVVLAAGRSSRMGGANKLLSPSAGRPLVACVVAHVCASRASEVVVVTGHDAGAVRAALRGLSVRFAHNEDHAQGMSSSLRRGLDALSPGVAGALICLADMPRVRSEDLDRLIDAFTRAGGDRVCVPMAGGVRGNPVLWPARAFDALRRLRGDVGGRRLLADEGDARLAVEIDHDGILFDVDTPDDLGD